MQSNNQNEYELNMQIIDLYDEIALLQQREIDQAARKYKLECSLAAKIEEVEGLKQTCRGLNQENSLIAIRLQQAKDDETRYKDYTSTLEFEKGEVLKIFKRESARVFQMVQNEGFYIDQILKKQNVNVSVGREISSKLLNILGIRKVDATVQTEIRDINYEMQIKKKIRNVAVDMNKDIANSETQTDHVILNSQQEFDRQKNEHNQSNSHESLKTVRFEGF